MKKLFFLLLISFSVFAQKDTTITRRKVVKFADKFFVEQTITSTTYKEFNINMIEEIDRKDDEEVTIQRDVQRMNKALSDKTAEKREFQRHLKQAITQGYKPEITNSREQEVYNKVLKKIN